LRSQPSHGIKATRLASVWQGDFSNDMPTVSSPAPRSTLDATVFWLRYKNELLIALIVIVLGAAAYGGYQMYKDQHSNAAADLLGAATSIPGYQQVIDRYPGTAAAASAYLLLAEQERGQKKYAEANATLRAFINKFPEHELLPSAHLAMAANLESLGKPDEALSTLQRLVTNYPKSFVVPVALIAEVHLLKAKGRTDEARRICENFLTQYRDSYLASEASRQLRLLQLDTKSKAVTTTPSAPAPPPMLARPMPAPSARMAPPPNPAPKKP
jgi:predicted negative regulator of RcsB-dependent stress response